jgi:hypothetical protein
MATNREKLDALTPYQTRLILTRVFDHLDAPPWDEDTIFHLAFEFKAVGIEFGSEDEEESQG